jgi:hypothetical protein
MCPACVAAAATIATGAASAGGMTALLVMTLRRKPVSTSSTATDASQGDDHEPAENRVGR